MGWSSGLRGVVAAALVLGGHGAWAVSWWNYLAAYPKGPGAVRVDMDLAQSGPAVDRATLVVAGVRFATERANGLPEARQVEALEALGARLVAAIGEATPAVHAGTFTHDRQHLSFLYVADAASVERAVDGVLREHCPGCERRLEISEDGDWSAYFEFLYPNAETRAAYRQELRERGFTER